MPIYAYRCATCGFQQDVLQKMSDPRLVTCPSCSNATFEKQVTAAGFQLKGSGWYVTDFRNPATKEATKTAKPESGDTAKDAAPATDANSAPSAPATTTSDSSPAPSAPAKAPPASGAD